MTERPLTDRGLDRLEALCAAASPAPWTVFAGPGIGGPDIIRLGEGEMPDMYVSHDNNPAPVADLDFIAAARNQMPLLIAEVRRLRSAQP
jgi:hypothetical protein